MDIDDENVIIREYSNTRFLKQSDMEDDYKMLEEIRPDYVIIYDPNLNFIRNLEVMIMIMNIKNMKKE